MKDYSKVEQAKKLLEESGVSYVIANKTEDGGGIVAFRMTPNELLNAITMMVSSIAEQAKETGVPKSVMLRKVDVAVIVGVEDGYGTLPKEDN